MAGLSHAELDEQRLLAAVRRPECGAVVVFVGTARRHTGEREAVRLRFFAYESMALQEMQAIEREASERYRLAACAIEHRLGDVPVGETAIVVAVSSPHRTAALEAAAWIMNELKRRVPIWKQEIAPDGTTIWVPNQLQPQGGAPLC